jgi:hypothetical protein
LIHLAHNPVYDLTLGIFEQLMMMQKWQIWLCTTERVGYDWLLNEAETLMVIDYSAIGWLIDSPK